MRKFFQAFNKELVSTGLQDNRYIIYTYGFQLYYMPMISLDAFCPELMIWYG